MRLHWLGQLSGLLLLAPAIALGQHHHPSGGGGLGGSSGLGGMSNLLQPPQQQQKQQQNQFQLPQQQPKSQHQNQSQNQGLQIKPQQQQNQLQSQQSKSQNQFQTQQPKQQQQLFQQTKPQQQNQSLSQGLQSKQQQNQSQAQQPKLQNQPQIQQPKLPQQNQSLSQGLQSKSQQQQNQSQQPKLQNQSQVQQPKLPQQNQSLSQGLQSKSQQQQNQSQSQQSKLQQPQLQNQKPQSTPSQSQQQQSVQQAQSQALQAKIQNAQQKPQDTKQNSGLPKLDSNSKQQAVTGTKPQDNKQNGALQKLDTNSKQQSVLGTKAQDNKQNGGIQKPDTNSKQQSVVGTKPQDNKQNSGLPKLDSNSKQQAVTGTKPQDSKQNGGLQKLDTNSKQQSVVGTKPQDAKQNTGIPKTDPNSKQQPLLGGKTQEPGKQLMTQEAAKKQAQDAAIQKALANQKNSNAGGKDNSAANQKAQSSVAGNQPAVGGKKLDQADLKLGKSGSRLQQTVASQQAQKIAAAQAKEAALKAARTQPDKKLSLGTQPQNGKTNGTTKIDKLTSSKPSDKVGAAAISKLPANKQQPLTNQLKQNQKALTASLKPQGAGKFDLKKLNFNGPAKGFGLGDNTVPGVGINNMTPSEIKYFSNLAVNGSPIAQQAAKDVLAGNITASDMTVLQTMFQQPNSGLSPTSLQALGMAIQGGQSMLTLQNSLNNTFDPNTVFDPLGGSTGGLAVNGGGFFPTTPGGQIGLGILQIIDGATGGKLGIPPIMNGSSMLMIPEGNIAGGYDPYATSGYCVSILDEQPLAYENAVMMPVSYSTTAYRPVTETYVPGLDQSVATTGQSAVIDPVTAEEQQMFDAMYADAGLDSAVLTVLDQHWKQSSAVGRKATYDAFMAQVAKSGGDNGGVTQASAEELVVEQAEPVTEAEQKMFENMYASLDLDANTMQVLRQNWASGTSASRLSEYNAFQTKLAAATGAAGSSQSQLAATDDGLLANSPSQLVPVTAVEQHTRYLRIANISDAPAKLHLQYFTEDSSGKWNWFPKAPAEGEESEVIALNPKEAADVEVDGWRLNASKVRIWGADSKGHEWNKFKARDLVLVPERNSLGELSYMDDNIQTYCFTVK